MSTLRSFSIAPSPISVRVVTDRVVAPLARSPTPLERSTQTLPVPLGGLAPVHRKATIQRVLRRHQSAPIVVLALVSASTGVWLSTSPRSFAVGRDEAGVHIDAIVLTQADRPALGGMVFSGAAAVAITGLSAGVVRAGAVMTWNGAQTTARCVLRYRAEGAAESCVYTIGATRLTSSDVYTAATRTWQRRYGDQVEVTIRVPGGTTLIPIPFPLGH